MIRRLILSAFLVVSAQSVAQDGNRAPLTLDEDVWVTFYDVPSRRFRSIRDAFVRGDVNAVARDLEISIGFLKIEEARVAVELEKPIAETIASIESISDRLGTGSVTVSHLDSTFARVHWILAQHYLVQAVQSRSQSAHAMAGRYLFATAHHIERSVLWSNATIDRDVIRSLESIRDMAGKLQSSDDPERVYRDRPMRLATRTLQKVGAHIDRTVRVLERLPQ